MKKILLILLVLSCCTIVHAADEAVNDMTRTNTPTDSMDFFVVADSSSTDVARRMVWYTIEHCIRDSIIKNSATTQILFNNSGIVDGAANLAWNNSTNVLTVTGTIAGYTSNFLFGFSADTASALTDTVKTIADNWTGATVTITEIFIWSDMQNYEIKLYEKLSDNTKSAIVTLTASTAGYDGYYARITSFTDASIANQSVIGFERPALLGKSVYVRGKGTYTVQ